MRTVTLPLLLTLTLGSTLALGACKHSADTADPNATATATPDGAGAGQDDEDPGKGRVSVGPRLAKLCNLTEPNFDFDSAALSRSAKSTLDALATCLTTGPGKDEDINLVGHADPRGDEEYNLGLGQRRATGVADYLRKQGVAEARMETSSRGEMDARGTDEASWAQDRRVDITLAN